jgi:pimeloyl-ACP methyl ester carboxylesterase
MDPQIEYARASDGLSIAFWRMGGGPPLVLIPEPTTSHAEVIWKMPHAREWLEALAERHELVWYDCRGSGLSDRDTSDFSPEAMTEDLVAVVSHAGLDRFALFSLAPLAAVAMRFAAEHPDVVSHLILFNCTARASDFMSVPLALELGILWCLDCVF